MPKGIFQVPPAVNEPIKSYAPGSPERADLKKMLEELRSQEVDIPMFIGGEEIRTGNTKRIHPPHEIKHTLGHYHQGDETHVHMAIDSALKAREEWANLSWEHRAAIFLKAADLLAGPYRQLINAATMLGQSKNAFQAEIDSACELADFFRFNVQYMTEIYAGQPDSAPGIWDRVEYRPLEGFVFALTPFNFTSIAGNLQTAPAMMGNVTVWKPSKTAVYSAYFLMKLFKEAGVPDGVINLVYASGPVAAKEIFAHPDFAGFHFTGSTGVFQSTWKAIGDNIEKYKTYPRIVGETGGKDYIMAHKSCDAKAVATAIVRGAFEYQGQKCSAASRAYMPAGRWNEIRGYVEEQMKEVKMGPPEDFSNFVNAVIDETSFDILSGAIDEAKASKEAEVIIGGGYDKSVGYFVEPTIILTTNPMYRTMEEELFGPILTIYVYEDNKFEETMDILDSTSIYALTGCIFAQDRYVIEQATKRLVNTAGNFYINDKPTGAVVGQQPFGGSRGSGTNDKAGSAINLMRWVSPRTIKETFVPAHDFKYPFLAE
ncbi:L-glutamate gamma-semialdehyde dehydrogenase [Carboxylicivirga sp. M1479]|uniref:L-glutamate gamma-semialdehyde dehydrogenase n=1 Tax=Carboxylicivirga sp. M1479 TaxID=2594476 RepID=UPI0011789377|nr:L-glutamate gamma-semialdehyde dehydrogenase [Carboxylicivirga sp. M1479]TRX70864.1 L-glutamate gamma-semialdehyde dehydrogenase [Carboxylicivirga sp. M1479]